VIADFVILYGKDGSITSIYEPVSVLAGDQDFEIAKFLRIHDAQEMLRTMPEDRQFASVIKYDHSEGKMLNVEVYDRSATLVRPLESVQTLPERLRIFDNATNC